ncbi:MlaD family protein [Gynurincola endophyticus]|jgi:phospholipid/cholesterol/gamma-HCH transport system substrate-binding protein|uniref:MlaD family protein n=1 Tax=Gynurincola endophyticus TaxID=2479004 RepID=UPI000F8D4737|nr:MlaD family protein [Gynurincola endophyticus]
MKISNETKIGALTAVAIAVLILGFNFLKGKSLSPGSKFTIYTEFQNIDGLSTSSPVSINGLPVGKVISLKEKDKNLSAIVVGIFLDRDLNIPDDSQVFMNSALLGGSSLGIELGQSTNYIQSGAVLASKPYKGMLDKIQGSLDPALASLNLTLQSVDSVMQKLGAILDPNTQHNLQAIVANLGATSSSLKNLLATNGSLQKSLTNIETLTAGFSNKQADFDRMITNFATTSDKFAAAPVDQIVIQLQSTLKQLDGVVAKMNSSEGSLGALIHDKKLYEEIRQTNRSLNTLLDDFRLHPKRYVNVSVFGRKDKTGPITAPVYDSTKAQ